MIPVRKGVKTSQQNNRWQVNGQGRPLLTLTFLADRDCCTAIARDASGCLLRHLENESG